MSDKAGIASGLGKFFVIETEVVVPEIRITQVAEVRSEDSGTVENWFYDGWNHPEYGKGMGGWFMGLWDGRVMVTRPFSIREARTSAKAGSDRA